MIILIYIYLVICSIKFYEISSFYGAVVNVTALPYTPHWVEEIEQDENFSTVKRYSGTDYFLLSSIASTLNFKINVIPTSNWDEVR